MLCTQLLHNRMSLLTSLELKYISLYNHKYYLGLGLFSFFLRSSPLQNFLLCMKTIFFSLVKCPLNLTEKSTGCIPVHVCFNSSVLRDTFTLCSHGVCPTVKDTCPNLPWQPSVQHANDVDPSSSSVSPEGGSIYNTNIDFFNIELQKACIT